MGAPLPVGDGVGEGRAARRKKLMRKRRQGNEACAGGFGGLEIEAMSVTHSDLLAGHCAALAS
jgi:hypothetical protein